ncbi:hypothetical protein [Rhodobacter sp. 24-YEA-8]|nr:hypothetical protein [Rhodobacter sp. 24-YEA-8]SED15773.1 hypothetical protein SAMN05519105_3488 [Rhodobacter sp. 24-YEA-8]
MRNKEFKYTHLITINGNVWIGAGATLVSLIMSAVGSLVRGRYRQM